ncbi:MULTISPECIES: GTP-binding protein [unclassified Anabaena]|uniref:GTP-binding protein n=1 Tax=unclassified Anabaena TaxID=2619674 RepID=UPI001446F425|nr:MULTISPECIES: GTP-binding protein [unclassified Anabaena]MTJ08625.1 GTP-binding protein [Anabaena sp. UHCC 0204]MTJ53863.1 GTP-binding protein [Anabaena sp. UHCC 0253]
MNIPIIKVIAGLSGAGKTTWICQQIRDIVSAEKVIYFCPGTGNVPIDQTRIATEFPELNIFGDGQEIEFLHHIPTANSVYVELGSYLELKTISKILDHLTYRAIAIIPPDLQNSEYDSWANEIIHGAPVPTITVENLWRVETTGQVIDENSLDEFWYEITHNAYGTVTRAKAIFDVNDGRSLYCDFVAGVPKIDFLELNLPRYLEGRPQRFSGIEIVGKNLDETTLKATLSDCCLSESLISQYQQQVQQILLEGEEV